MELEKSDIPSQDSQKGTAEQLPLIVYPFSRFRYQKKKLYKNKAEAVQVCLPGGLCL